MTGHDDVTSEVHALSGAYAVDALDAEERASFERHLEHCAACQAEVAGLQEAVAGLAADAEADPPPGLRDRVLAGIATVRPLPPVTMAPGVRSLRSGRSGRTRRFPGLPGPQLVLAAAVLAVVAVAAAAWLRPWSDPAPAPSAAEQVLSAEDATRTTQRFPNGSSATVVVSRERGRAVVVTDDMAPAPAGSVYQVWLQTPADAMVPAGLMPDDPDVTLLLDGDASDAVGVGITVEPDGGSSRPTTEPIALLPLEG